ncbi:MAG: hypothetical protein MZV64_00670 [Ignavibacteriales bacterium]|nr:hypothetical protein [Ignavibacteriales bacterium]
MSRQNADLSLKKCFTLNFLLRLRKNNYQTKLIGNKMEIKSNLVSDFIKTLPFELTHSQLNVLSEIKKDMLSEKPMNRLLQGDVGSGKTIVALIAMMIAVDNGLSSCVNGANRNSSRSTCKKYFCNDEQTFIYYQRKRN